MISVLFLSSCGTTKIFHKKPKVRFFSADNIGMNIGAISSLASSLQSSDPTWASGGIQQSIGAAVLKQSQNADAKQAQALVKMIQEETPKPSSSGAGSIINIGA